MATTTLADALGGLRITGAENPYGMGLIALTQAAPNLYNPYGKTSTNFGIALGQALLSGLLGYQAKKQATEESLQATDLASQLIAKPAAERATFLKGLAAQDTPTNVMSRLTEISPILLQNELAAKAEQAAARKKLEQDVALEYVKQTGNLPAGFESLAPLAVSTPTVDVATQPALAGLNPKQQREVALAKAKTIAEEEAKAPTREKEKQFSVAKELQSTRRTLEDDPITKAYAEGKSALRSARELAQKDSVTATIALKKIAERGFNPGNQVTMQELRAYESVMPILDKYKTWITSKATGSSDLTPTARAELVNAVETVVNNLGKSYNEKVQNNFDFVKKQGWTTDIKDVAPVNIHVPRAQVIEGLKSIEQRLTQDRQLTEAGKTGMSPATKAALKSEYDRLKGQL